MFKEVVRVFLECWCKLFTGGWFLLRRVEAKAGHLPLHLSTKSLCAISGSNMNILSLTLSDVPLAASQNFSSLVKANLFHRRHT